MVANKLINIEVAYASRDQAKILAISVPEGTIIVEAIQLSGVLQLFPEIDLDKQAVGIFSKKRQLTDLVGAGDRIEIYRPLTIDPKEARRAKAKSKVKRTS